VLLAPGTSAASVATRFIQKLRQISILGGVYPVVAALGLVALIVGLIGLVAVHATNKEVRELEDVANRAFFAQRASALIYAVVADSRGVYMSSEAADRATYGTDILRSLAELEANMAEWKGHVAPDNREGFARAQARADEFIRFRTELVRLGNEVGQVAARAWGDTEANRTNREALNREIDALAEASYAELAQLRARINAYSTWGFIFAATIMAGGIALTVVLIALMVARYRKDTATQVASKEAYLAEAQRLSHTGSFGWSAASGFIWSDETFRIFGMDRATVPSIETVIQRTHPEDVERVRQFIETARRDGQDCDLEHRLLMPDGGVKHLHVVARAQRDEAGELEFVGAVMDVTAAKRAEEAVHKAQAELAHATRMTTLGELTAWIAHEVKQPLTAIVLGGAACLRWLAREPPAMDEARSSVEHMTGEAERANDIINRIRALARNSEPEKAPLDINDLIHEVVRLVRREMLANEASLRLELAPALPAVLGDRVQLQQVLINLVINAIQAMASVADRPREVRIRSQQRDDGHVLVAVTDSGSGIAAENMNELFKAFFTTKPSGMGMGLSICRSIIEAHGGRVSAANNAGPGVTFQFTLPIGP
jgi:PAS domain S-box-containing protein